MNLIRHKPTEATIQAELYCALKSAKITAILEQSFLLQSKTRSGRPKKIRVDVALCFDDQIFGAIEVKSRNEGKDVSSYLGTKQANKYTELGLPFRYCTRMDEIGDCVLWAASLGTRDQSSAGEGGNDARTEGELT